MCSHIGKHILCASSNVPEEVVLKEQVGDMMPCGFCGRSGIPECTITIKVPVNGTPTWDTKCMFQHKFKYGFADSGSKNQPCRNIPVKCDLCHPALPPEPGKTSQKPQAIAVEAVWRYNMPNHVVHLHKEYIVPGRREGGVMLPPAVWKAMKLTDLEQSVVRILKDRWQSSFAAASELDKENMQASGSRGAKRPALESSGSLPSKHARTSVSRLQTALTSLN